MLKLANNVANKSSSWLKQTIFFQMHFRSTLLKLINVTSRIFSLAFHLSLSRSSSDFKGYMSKCVIGKLKPRPINRSNVLLEFQQSSICIALLKALFCMSLRKSVWLTTKVFPIIKGGRAVWGCSVYHNSNYSMVSGSTLKDSSF